MGYIVIHGDIHREKQGLKLRFGGKEGVQDVGREICYSGFGVQGTLNSKPQARALNLPNINPMQGTKP